VTIDPAIRNPDYTAKASPTYAQLAGSSEGTKGIKNRKALATEVARDGKKL